MKINFHKNYLSEIKYFCGIIDLLKYVTEVFGAYIYCYITYKAVPKNTRIGTICFLWLSLIISMILVNNLHIRLFLTAVGIGVTIHVMKLRVLSDEEMKEFKRMYADDNQMLPDGK